MKKVNLFFLSAVFTLAAFLLGCSPQAIAPDLFLETDTPNIAFTQEGGTKSVTINASSSNWIGGSDVDWLTVTKDGDKLVVVSGENKGGKERTANITIKIASQQVSKTIAVSQFGTDPSIKLEEETYKVNYNGITDKKIQVLANTKDWTVSQMEPVDWISYKADQENGQVLLSIKPIDKDSSNSADSRNTILVFSNGTSHAILNITQTGWSIFSEVLFGHKLTREEIQQYEESKVHTRDKEYEAKHFKLWVEERKQEAPVMAFKTDALQSVYSMYRFDNKDVNKYMHSRIQAADGQTFNQEEFDAWIYGKRYKKVPVSKGNSEATGNGHRSGSSSQGTSEATFYYQQTEDGVNFVELHNSASAQDHSFDAKAAYAIFGFNSNEIQVDDTNLQNYPIRTTETISNLKYKIEDIIKWEAARGMVPAIKHENTKMSEVKGYETYYQMLTFVPKDGEDNHKKYGELFRTVYFFNIPGYREKNMRGQYVVPDGYVDAPEYAGTVAKRGDVYYGAPGYRVRKTKNPYYPRFGEQWDTKLGFDFTTIEKAKKSGFSLIRLGDEVLNITYFKRENEISYMEPKQLSSGDIYSVYFFFKDVTGAFSKEN